MTTIAYKNGILAADSLITGAAMCCGSATKICKGENGMGGCAGYAADAEKFCDWIKNGGDIGRPLNLGNETNGLFIRSDGSKYFYSDGGFSRFDAKFAAVGSGEQFAMAAMLSGKSAKGAVKVACKLDCYSGGKIQTISMRD